MTQEIIDMARQAGMVYRKFQDEFANANTDGVDLKTIEAFAALVAAREQEKICRQIAALHDSIMLASHAILTKRGEA